MIKEGRYYWEVVVDDQSEWAVGAAYTSVERNQLLGCYFLETLSFFNFPTHNELHFQKIIQFFVVMKLCRVSKSTSQNFYFHKLQKITHSAIISRKMEKAESIVPLLLFSMSVKLIKKTDCTNSS